jgi:hypothetical protein
MSYIWKTTGCIQQHCHGNLKENVKLDDGRNRKRQTRDEQLGRDRDSALGPCVPPCMKKIGEV